MGTDVEVLAVGADAAAMAELGELAADRARGARGAVVALPAHQRAVPAQRRRRRAGRGVGRHLRADRARRRRVARRPAVATTRRCSPRSKPRATTATSTPSRAATTAGDRAGARRSRAAGAWSSTTWCRAVRLPSGVALDLGGIGKGFAAADAVSTELLAAGIPGVRGVLVNLGGDLRARGDAPLPHGWVVDVDDPLATGRTGLLASARVRSPRARGLRRAWTRGDRRAAPPHRPPHRRAGRVGAGVGHGGGRRGVAGGGVGQGGVRRRSRRGRAPRRATPVPPGCS